MRWEVNIYNYRMVEGQVWHFKCVEIWDE